MGDGIAAAIDAGFDAVFSCDIAPAHLEATKGDLTVMDEFT